MTTENNGGQKIDDEEVHTMIEEESIQSWPVILTQQSSISDFNSCQGDKSA